MPTRASAFTRESGSEGRAIADVGRALLKRTSTSSGRRCSPASGRGARSRRQRGQDTRTQRGHTRARLHESRHASAALLGPGREGAREARQPPGSSPSPTLYARACRSGAVVPVLLGRAPGGAPASGAGCAQLTRQQRHTHTATRTVSRLWNGDRGDRAVHARLAAPDPVSPSSRVTDSWVAVRGRGGLARTRSPYCGIRRLCPGEITSGSVSWLRLASKIVRKRPASPYHWSAIAESVSPALTV
jgi:hypothetical protein